MASLTAIIVDDEKDVSELFSDLIELRCIKIVGLGFTGFHAISLVNEKKPDVVFLNIHMPELNGVEALKEIKKNYPKTHVVMITSDVSVDVKKLSQYGAIATLFKPFDMQKIMQVIDEIQRSKYKSS